MGMHSGLHPALRCHWTGRMATNALLSAEVVGTSFSKMAASISSQFKECIRRLVSTSTASACATVAAMTHIDHPMALLQLPPFRLPAAGLEASTTAFAAAGARLSDERGAVCLAEAVAEAFEERAAPAGADADAEASQLVWRASYLGARPRCPPAAGNW
jgi:hypothetical protein